MILDYLIYKLTEENPPEVNAAKCINSSGGIIECNICKEYCPEHAILFKDKSVVFDNKLCTKCGICKVKCPTQAVKIKEIGEENILINAGEKKNLVFSCSLEETIGNLNISCLNALHSELISSLFILYKEKKIHFNLSKCKKCEMGYKDDLFRENLNKAVNFTKSLGIDPVYELHTEENELPDLICEEISRRNLFKLVKKESSNVVLKTLNTVINAEDNQLLSRNVLIKSIESIKLNNEKNYTDIFWEYWDVNASCDGCGKCEAICPENAWKLEKTAAAIKLYHKFSNCYKCGLCEKVCHNKAITKGFDNFGLLEFKLKREINLSTCKLCNEKFISDSQDDECDVCKKKELLRRKISKSI